MKQRTIEDLKLDVDQLERYQKRNQILLDIYRERDRDVREKIDTLVDQLAELGVDYQVF